MRQSEFQQRQQTSQMPQTGSQSRLPRPVIPGQEEVRQSADLPGYKTQQKQVGNICTFRIGQHLVESIYMWIHFL